MHHYTIAPIISSSSTQQEPRIMRYWKVQHPDGSWSQPLPTWTAAALYAQQVGGTVYAY